jgi:hypothetical protein
VVVACSGGSVWCIQADFCHVWLGLACGGSSDFCKGRRATTTRYDHHTLRPLHATTATCYYRYMLVPAHAHAARSTQQPAPRIGTVAHCALTR